MECCRDGEGSVVEMERVEMERGSRWRSRWTGGRDGSCRDGDIKADHGCPQDGVAQELSRWSVTMAFLEMELPQICRDGV